MIASKGLQSLVEMTEYLITGNLESTRKDLQPEVHRT